MIVRCDKRKLKTEAGKTAPSDPFIFLVTIQTEKKTGLQTLCEMKGASDREKYRNIPEHARIKPKYNDSTSNGLTACIMDFIRLKGGFAARVNTTGIVRKGKYTKGGGTVGAADINAIISGRSVQIEVKVKKDQLSDAQIKQAERIRAAGGVFYVARTFQEFFEWYCETF